MWGGREFVVGGMVENRVREEEDFLRVTEENLLWGGWCNGGLISRIESWWGVSS